MRRLLPIFLIVVAGAVVYMLFWPSPIDPVVFAPPPNPGLAGPYAANEALRVVERLAPGIGPGPEDVTKGPDGFFFTGLQDGRIVRFRENGSAETFVDTRGRPLGMQFDAHGNLIVADAFRGLLAVAPDRKISILTDRAGGERLLFPNDLDIASDGTVWFSDSSRRFNQHHYLLDFLETRATGRLLAYDPRTGQTKVRLDRLMFPNGVALGPGEEFVLVNETVAARITRLWVRGPKAGRSETFAALPGYPDNLSYNGKGIFWVALPARRDQFLERTWASPFVRKILARLPEGAIRAVSERPYGWVIGLNPNGEVVRNLQSSGDGYSTITSVNEFDGKLYLGSIAMSSVGRYRLQ